MGTERTADGAPWSLSGVTVGECVCGLPSKLAQARPTGAPPVPTSYTLCRATVGKAVNGQDKHSRAKRSQALLKVISLGVNVDSNGVGGLCVGSC